MPLYEYKCDKCGHRFEKIEKHSASEMKKCPKCGAHAPRQLSAPGIQFKGSGWYVTDYGGKGSAPTGEGSGDGSPSKSEKSEKSGKSEKSQKSDSKSGDSKSASDKSDKSGSKKDRK